MRGWEGNKFDVSGIWQAIGQTSGKPLSLQQVLPQERTTSLVDSIIHRGAWNFPGEPFTVDTHKLAEVHLKCIAHRKWTQRISISIMFSLISHSPRQTLTAKISCIILLKPTKQQNNSLNFILGTWLLSVSPLEFRVDFETCNVGAFMIYKWMKKAHKLTTGAKDVSNARFRAVRELSVLNKEKFDLENMETCHEWKLEVAGGGKSSQGVIKLERKQQICMQRISIPSLSLRRFQLSDYDSCARLKHFNEQNWELCRCDDKKVCLSASKWVGKQASTEMWTTPKRTKTF
jgi:hypothetical protein